MNCQPVRSGLGALRAAAACITPACCMFNTKQLCAGHRRASIMADTRHQHRSFHTRCKICKVEGKTLAGDLWWQTAAGFREQLRKWASWWVATVKKIQNINRDLEAHFLSAKWKEWKLLKQRKKEIKMKIMSICCMESSCCNVQNETEKENSYLLNR